jgi:hypothetical protein
LVAVVVGHNMTAVDQVVVALVFLLVLLQQQQMFQ